MNCAHFGKLGHPPAEGSALMNTQIIVGNLPGPDDRFKDPCFVSRGGNSHYLSWIDGSIYTGSHACNHGDHSVLFLMNGPCC